MKRIRFLWGAALSALVLAAACGPAAEPTATTGAQPTATKAAAATSTTAAAAATATTAPAAATATRPAAVATATVASARVHPIPIMGMPPQNPAAKKGGIFRDGSTAPVPDFGVWDSAVGTTLEVAVQTTDSLLDRNEFEPRKQDQILTNFAYDWWTNAAGTEYTFLLTKGAKFFDGKEVTCADVEFSLETLRDARDATGATLRRSPRARWLSRVKDISCPDPYTVSMKTDGTPLPSLPATLAVSSFAILPKHTFEGNLDLTWKEPAKNGMGTFIPNQYVPGEKVVFKRNPNYWNQPYPYLDGYESINFGSTTAGTAAFRVGRAEGGITLPPTIRKQLMDEGKMWQPVTGSSDGFTGYQANFTRAPWNDPRFSLAMRCAIDTAQVNATGNDGEGYEGPAGLPASDSGIEGAPDWAITMAEWQAVHPCHGPSGDAANMEKRRQMARDLLAQMGFTAQNPAKPTSYYANPDRTFEVVQNNLALVGIQVQAKVVTTSERYEIQTNATMDILQQGFVTSRRDPDHWFYEQYFGTSDRNYGRYQNAEIDALIDKQSRTLDKAERYKIIKEIQLMLLKNNAKVAARVSQNTRAFAIWARDIYWNEPANNQNTAAKYARVWIDPDLKAKFGG